MDRSKLGVRVRRELLVRVGATAIVVLVTAAGCSQSGTPAETPGLAARGTTMTTAKPTRQDLANKVSLSGKVTLGPVFGLAAPVSGEIRYLDVSAPTRVPTRPTHVASIRASGRTHRIEVPAGAVFAGRLVENRSKVTVGMPIVSAKRSGYGIVADIDGAQAYQISDSLTTVQAQIKSGPGPFPCTVLGTIAALPAGTIPDPPADPAAGQPAGQQPAGQQPGKPADQPPTSPPPPSSLSQSRNRIEPSESTGMRLICTAPAGIKLINGASATIEVVTARAKNALVLPVEAVAGAQGRGKVDVLRPDGNRETRDVVLGLSDGKVVEIRSGLTGSETVAVPGPNLPPGQPGQGEGKGGPVAPMGGK